MAAKSEFWLLIRDSAKGMREDGGRRDQQQQAA